MDVAQRSPGVSGPLLFGVELLDPEGVGLVVVLVMTVVAAASWLAAHRAASVDPLVLLKQD